MFIFGSQKIIFGFIPTWALKGLIWIHMDTSFCVIYGVDNVWFINCNLGKTVLNGSDQSQIDTAATSWKSSGKFWYI